ncbi:hypothetical protein ACP70R_015474 [Stipagrostis hirtigluma subsp. patula]
MEGDKGPPPPPPLRWAASASAVFSNDDLLREILVRLGFPTFLVRAALVSERWLRHAADPTFLRRFRALHPPHLLGFYVDGIGTQRPPFVPVSQAPELAAAVSRCRFDDSFPELFRLIDCRNGRRLLFELSCSRDANYRYAVLSPLRQAPSMVSLPLPPKTHPLDLPGPGYSHHAYFLPKDEDDGVVFGFLCIFRVNVSAHVYVLQSGNWVLRWTAETELSKAAAPWGFIMTTVRGKFYVVSLSGYIIGFDLAASSLFVVKLPDAVRMDGLRTNVKLLCGEDSRLFLVHGEGAQLSVWHHENHADAARDWILVDTITVLEARNRGEDALVLAVGDNAEFVFVGLEASGIFICVNMRSRTETVHDVPMKCDMRSINILPNMMVWPPVFPALNEDHEQAE